MSLRGKKPSRKSAFRAALALAGLTQSEWAVQRGGVTPGHLSLVLQTDRESARLTALIDAFIAEYLPARGEEWAA